MWGFLIVVAVFIFVTAIVKMALAHAENIERIKHGYPPIEGGERLDEHDFIDVRENERQQ